MRGHEKLILFVTPYSPGVKKSMKGDVKGDIYTEVDPELPG
jgi:hypothetical protein